MSKAFIYEQKSILKTARFWVDATKESSIGAPANNDPLNLWSDISGSGINADQVSIPNQPTYVTSGISGLPSVAFSGANQFFDLPDDTIPSGNSDYTIFVVSQAADLANGVLLTSGLNADNEANVFTYLGGSDGFRNYWWNNDVTVGSVITPTSPNVLTFKYENNTSPDRNLYANGVLVKTNTSATDRNSSVLNNRIGIDNNLFNPLNGMIGEIIIFDRALSDSQRAAIDSYLTNKWST